MNKFSSLDGILKNDESRAWIKAVLDPFHDTQLDVEGLPDMRLAPSVVQVHTQSMSITAPSSVGTGNFDCSVLYTGIDCPISAADAPGKMITMSQSSIHTFDHTSIILSGGEFGALNIWAGATGNMSTGSPGTANDTYAAMGSVLQTDRCRTIAVGVEIHNTTAEVYKQGSLTVAQLPDTSDDAGMVFFYDTSSTKANVGTQLQADRCCVQANTVSFLQQVPGSKTWPAAEGCYMIPRLSKIQQAVPLLAHNVVATGAGPSQNATGANQTRAPILYGSDGKTATLEPKGWLSVSSQVALVHPAMSPSGFSPCQIFMSNLSNQTSLTIVFRTVVEYFPSVGSALLPLATPSPNFDPFILALYSEVIKDIPFAVKVADNESGSLFRDVVRAILVALQAGSPLMGQYGPLVAGAARAVQIGLDSYRSSSQIVKKKK
jgi:hypothetical protein